MSPSVPRLLFLFSNTSSESADVSGPAQPCHNVPEVVSCTLCCVTVPLESADTKE